jgi:hypothetical protein
MESLVFWFVVGVLLGLLLPYRRRSYEPPKQTEPNDFDYKANQFLKSKE